MPRLSAFMATCMASVLLSSVSASAQVKSIALIQDGRPVGCIVVAKGAPPVVQFAAQELQSYLSKSSGAKLPIVSAMPEASRPAIVLGAAAAGMGVTAEGLARDAFRIKSVGSHIAIVGRDDASWNPNQQIERPANSWFYTERGTLLGAYDFLERYVGVRWYLPIDIGEVVPSHATLAVPSMDLTEAPAKAGRFIHPYFGANDRDDPQKKQAGGFWPDLDAKGAAQFARERNLFFMRLRHQTAPGTGGHSMQHLISVKRFGDTHPEFFALLSNGKRDLAPGQTHGNHHCYSSKEMLQVVIEDVVACFEGKSPESRGINRKNWDGLVRDTPWGKAFQMLQNDGYKLGCQCDDCIAARTPGAPEAEAHAELLWSFWINVAKAVQARVPGALISVSAYGPTRNPPRAKLPENMIITIATQGPYSEFVPGAAESERALIETWAARIPRERISFYNYAHAAGSNQGRWRISRHVCGSIPRAYAAYYKRYADTGYAHYMYLMSGRFAYDHLSIYVYYKYLWNPETDIDALLNEYYTLFYGPAREPMRKFWEEIETSFYKVLSTVVETPEGPEVTVANERTRYGSIYTREVIDRWKGYFAQAEQAAGADTIYAKRVAYMKRNVMEDIEQGFLAYENVESKAAKTRMKVRRTSTPPVADGQLDDAAWKQAEPVSLSLAGGAATPVRTEVRALWDDKNLYLAIQADEPQLNAMRATVTTNGVAELWRDSGVEIFLDAENNGATYYQILYSQTGASSEIYFTGARKKRSGEWVSKSKSALVKLADAYVLEMAIPLESLKAGRPSAGDIWAANFIRKRTLKGQRPHDGELHTWSPLVTVESGWGRPDLFGKLEFVE